MDKKEPNIGKEDCWHIMQIIPVGRMDCMSGFWEYISLEENIYQCISLSHSGIASHADNESNLVISHSWSKYLS